jgi:carbamate kinase
MSKLAMVAFGGNALLRAGQKGTFEEQLSNVEQTCGNLVSLIKRGYNIVIGHGNGPQVGNVLLQHEAGRREFGLAALPMDYCGAETQGGIAYLIETAMDRVLARNEIKRKVVSLVTRVEVSASDPGFKNPTKPVGPYYSKEEADALAAQGNVMREDPRGRGWRKVVPSPVPIGIANIDVVKDLASQGFIVVTVGGGGIPVVRVDGTLKGVEAVIDKDLASALAAVTIGADEFYILTDVDKAYINFRQPDEKALDVITVAQAREYLAQGQFAEGSMAPKIRAGIMFVEHSGGSCVITEAGRLEDPSCGTRIVP